MTSKAIAKEYRAYLAWVRQQPEDLQWQYGPRLKELQTRFTVEREAEQVRSK